MAFWFCVGMAAAAVYEVAAYRPEYAMMNLFIASVVLLGVRGEPCSGE